MTTVLARVRDVVTDGSDVVASPAPWRPVAALLLSLAGLGVSVYLTIDHFAKIKLVCAESGVVNCQKVTTSAQSHFLGIPVAVLGLVFFVAMTALNVPALWRAADRRVHLARLVLALAGIAFVLYLVAAELLIIGSICLWCTSVHVITFLLLVLLVSTIPPMLGWSQPPAPVPTRRREQREQREQGARGPRSSGGGARAPAARPRSGSASAGRTRR